MVGNSRSTARWFIFTDGRYDERPASHLLGVRSADIARHALAQMTLASSSLR